MPAPALLARLGLPARVRTRLLAAFLSLLAVAVLLALTGWAASRRMQRELEGVENELLPRVFDALALSERATRLAALTPKLGEAASLAEAVGYEREVQALVEQLRAGADALRGPTPELQRAVERLRRDLREQLPALSAQARRRLVLQARLDAAVTRLGALGPSLHGPRRDARLSDLWSTLVLGSAVNDGATIGRTEADAEALMAALRAHGGLAALPAEDARQLVALTHGPDALMTVRHSLVEVEARIAYLVALTRLDADDMSAEATRYVAQVQSAAAARGERLRTAADASKALMLTLTLLSLATALLSTRSVRRLVGGIETIASLMSRLADGDTTAHATPATGRRDELGELARSFEVFRDTLLAKQQLVLDLDAQRELLAAVLDNLTDGLAVFGRDGRLLLHNARLVDLLAQQGVTPAIGQRPQDLFDLLPPGTAWNGQHRGFLALAQLPRDGWLRADHLELLMPDGQVLDLRGCAMPGGGHVTLVTDLSARRAIEAQLQQAQKLEVLGQLTGGVAHDFNNYLGTILGNLELLEPAIAADAPARRQWQRVQRAATSAAGLTRRLLAFARRQPLRAEDVDPVGMLHEMRDLIEYSAGATVDVRLELPERSRALHVDRGQLENALLNLVGNSASAMPRGGTLTIAVAAVPAPAGRSGPWLEIAVADDGIGMAAADAAKAFEPFFSTKPVGQGTGLGLSIVYGFVRQSGGEVALDSQLGTGTCVRLRFPALAGEPALPAVAAAPRLPAPLPGRTLLLVDDDDAFRQTLSEQLAGLAVHVHSVAGAADALAALAAGVAVDGLVSDIRLGQDSSGMLLAAEVQARWPGLPVLLMSGEFAELDPAAAVRGASPGDGPAGLATPFLQKPFALSELAAWVAALPQRRSQPA